MALGGVRKERPGEREAKGKQWAEKEGKAEACLVLLFHVSCYCGGEMNDVRGEAAPACCSTQGSDVFGVRHEAGGQEGRAQS